MGTDSDNVRAYLGRMEQDSRDLAELRSVLDRYRRAHVVADGASGLHSMTNESDYDVVARLSFATSRQIADANEKGILLGLRAAAMLARDHDVGDEHDATLDALAEKIERMTAEGARSLVEAGDCERAHSIHRAPGATGPVRPGEDVYDSQGRRVGAVAMPPKPCPMKDCNLPCDDGHTHVTAPPKVKLRAGQIWRAPDGAEQVVPAMSPSTRGTLWVLRGMTVAIETDEDGTVINTGGCTLVYDPRGM